MKIITTPDPRLREKSEKVTKIDDEILGIIENMRKLSLDWEKEHPYELSAAMAAPQMGVNKRIIIVRDDMADKSKATFTALINPEVIKADGKVKTDFEGCLSVPFKATDELARTLLHEIDHLDGVLFIDHIKGVKDAFYEMDDKGDLRPIDYDEKIANNKELFPDE